MKRNFFETFLTSQRISDWAFKLLISLLMVCVAISIMQFGARLTAGKNWNGWYLPVFTWLVSIEAMATRGKLKDLDPNPKLLYHVSEWVIFAILLKVFHYLMVGPDQIWSDLPRWQMDFLNFFEGDYLPVLAVMFFAWLMSGSLINDLEELKIEMTDLKWELGKLDNNRQAARQRMAEKIFAAGGFMVFVTLFTRLDLQVLWGETPASQASIANVLVYFLLTLVFLSITQFSLLRGRWFWNQTPMAPEIGKNWFKYSLLFFAVLAAIAFILPTRYTFSLLQVLQIFFNILSQLMILLFTLITFPCTWLLMLLGLRPIQPEPLTPIRPPLLDNLQTAGSPSPWWELVKSIVFWSIFVGIIVFAFVNFLRQHPGIVKKLLHIPGFHWLIEGFKSLWSWVKGMNQQIAATIASGWQRIFRSGSKALRKNIERVLNFKQLSPRQQVIFYYLRLLDRSKKSGIDRKPYQTPDQFAIELEQFVPDVQQDIHSLTETFVEARYSNHSIGTEHTSAVQKLWRKIVRRLKPQKPTE
jgi:hypothetical protein